MTTEPKNYVRYRFNNGTWIYFKSHLELDAKKRTENRSTVGYQISVTSRVPISGVNLTLAVRGHFLGETTINGGQTFYAFHYLPCDEDGYKRWIIDPDSAFPTYPYIRSTEIVINSAIACPTCKETLEITDIQGNVLTTISGSCTLEFEIVNNPPTCPDGYMLCEQAGYPKYKCVPCSEFTSGIDRLINLAKGVNEQG